MEQNYEHRETYDLQKAMRKIEQLTRERDEAVAERDAARAVLKAVEWVQHTSSVGHVWSECPCCYQDKPHHDPDCALARALGEGKEEGPRMTCH